MRRPKGIKTKKSIAKRFRITGTGKVMHASPGRRHLLSTKSAKRRRRLGEVAQLSVREAHKISQSLPWNH